MLCPVPPRTSASPLLQALKNEPLTLFGDGKQTRSFQYVSDLIEGGCLLPCLPACWSWSLACSADWLSFFRSYVWE